MPFRSEAQRRWMFANKPEMAKEWASVTPKDKKLPEKVGTMNKEAFWKGFEKRAGIISNVGNAIKSNPMHFAEGAAEVGGLGALAIPSIQQLRGKPMSENTKSKIEVGGLATLAAPYVYKGVKALAHG